MRTHCPLLVVVSAALALLCYIPNPATAGTLYRNSTAGASWNANNTWSLTSGGGNTNYVSDSDFVWDANSAAGTTISNGSSQSANSVQFGRTGIVLTTNTAGTLTLKGDISGSGESVSSFTAGNNAGGNTLTLQVQSAVDYSGRFNNAANVLNVTIGSSSNQLLTLSNTSAGSMTGVLEVNNTTGGGLILSGTMTSASTLRIREGGGRRVAAESTVGLIDLKAGTGGGGGLHIGNNLSAGTPGSDLSGQSLTWAGGSDSTLAAKIVMDLNTSSNVSDSLNLLDSFTKETTLGSSFLFDFNGVDFTGVLADRSYTLVTFSNTTFTSGSEFSFTGINLGTGSGAFELTENSLRFNYAAVPEPTTGLLLLAALGLWIGMRRRRA